MTESGRVVDSTRRRAAAVLLAGVVVTTGACTGEEPDPDPQPVADTWTVPDDVCARLDLTGILTEVVTTPQQPPRPDTETFEPDVAGCSASAGTAFRIEVELRTATDADEHANDWDRAQALLEVPSAWPEMGEVAEADTGTDPAPWAQRADTSAFSLVLDGAGSEGLPDPVYLNHVVAADDDNLVAMVTVRAAGPNTPAFTLSQAEAAEAVAAATAAVPEALGS